MDTTYISSRHLFWHVILICPLWWTHRLYLHYTLNIDFSICPLWWTHLFQTRYIINRWFWYLSTLVDTAFISSRHLYERHHLNLSTFVDTPLSAALHDRTLILALVHFSGRSLAILDIYLSVLFQFVHFSGHPSFRRITWQNIDLSTCPL